VFQYIAYGVRLLSDTAFPELDPHTRAPQNQQISIQVRLRDTADDAPVTAGWFSKSTSPNGRNVALWGKLEGGYLLRYPGLADFFIDHTGRQLRCAHIEPGTSPAILRHLLLDRVLPLVLNLLGHDVLHATAVETPAGVCAFIGPAGAGKSTLAASFAAAGYTTFCDDCLVIQLNGEILCAPGYPGLRLWSDSLAALDPPRVQPSNVAGCCSKFRIIIKGRQGHHGLRPLVAIYRIDRSAAGELGMSTVRIERLQGHEAFMELVSSAYVFDVTEPRTLIRHFHFVGGLVARVPAARLLLPNNLALLPAARRAILNDLRNSLINSN
jgi:hypothetical protein